MKKRSECRCACHSDAVTLGIIPPIMHVAPCCEPDENLVVPEDWCPFCKKSHPGGNTCMGHYP